MTVCVADTIDQIRIYPDQKLFDFGLAAISLLVSKKEKPAKDT